MSMLSLKPGIALFFLVVVVLTSCKRTPPEASLHANHPLPVLDPVGSLSSDSLFLLPLDPAYQFEGFHPKMEIIDDPQRYFYSEPSMVEIEPVN